jgi:hypothetical protein
LWTSSSTTPHPWRSTPNNDCEWLGIGTNTQDIINVTIRPAPTVDDDEFDVFGRQIFRRYHLETIYEEDDKEQQHGTKEDSLLLFSDVVEGAHLVRIPFVDRNRKKNRYSDEWDRLEWYQSPQSQFLINPDNTLSPVSQPDLVVAMSLPTVELVHRNSPHRLQFQHANLTQTHQSPIPMEIIPPTTNGSSKHPRLGLTVVSAFGLSSSSMRIGNGAQIQHVYLGEHDPNNHHTLLELEVMDNQKHLEFNLFVRTTNQQTSNTHPATEQTMYLTPWNMELTLGNRVVLMGYNEEEEMVMEDLQHHNHRGSTSRSITQKLLQTSLRKSSQATWKFNWEDGTLSPMDAPHLVLGCQSIRVHSSPSKTQRTASSSQSKIHASSNVSTPILNTTIGTFTAQQSILFSNHTNIQSSPSSPSFRQLESLALGILLVEETYPISVLAIGLILILLIIKMLPTAVWIALVVTVTWGPEAAAYCVVLQIFGQILWDWTWREYFSKVFQPAMKHPKEEKQDE